MFNGYRGTFRGVKCLGCDSDRAPVSTTNVKNEWKNMSASHVYQRGVDRDKCGGGGGCWLVGCCMLLLFHSCLGEEQPLLYVLITDRSHFTQFLFVPFCFKTKMYTTFECTQ